MVTLATLNLQVNNADDDAYTYRDSPLKTPSYGNVVNSTAFYGGYNSALVRLYAWAVRFTGASIPVGSTITLATLQIYVNSRGGTIYGSIYGIDQNNVSTFTGLDGGDGLFDTTAFPHTSASVSQDPGSAGGWKSITVTSIIQEIIDRGDWDPSDGIIALKGYNLTQTGYNMSIRAYDISPGTWGAKLDITYSPPVEARVIGDGLVLAT